MAALKLSRQQMDHLAEAQKIIAELLGTLKAKEDEEVRGCTECSGTCKDECTGCHTCKDTSKAG